MKKNACTQQINNEFVRSYIGGEFCNYNYDFEFGLPPHFQRSIMFDFIFMNDNNKQTVQVDIIDITTQTTTVSLSGKNTRLQGDCMNTSVDKEKDFDQFYRGILQLFQNQQSQFFQYQYKGSLQQKNTQGTNLKIRINESCKYNVYLKDWEEDDLKNLKIGTLQLNISLCDPACLTCSNTDNCITCSETKSGNTCTCTDQSKFLLKGQCVQQCESQQFYFPFNKKCIFLPFCTDINVDSGICIKCQSNLFLFNGQCISSCPAGFENIVQGNVCEDQNNIPGKAIEIIRIYNNRSYLFLQPYLLKGILSSNNFSILETDKLGIQVTNNFCNDSNCSVISLCQIYQLLGGFYINQKETNIKLPKFTTNKKFAKIILRYFFIDAASSSQPNNLQIFISLNSQSQQIDATQSTKSNICGLSKDEWFGIFSHTFTLQAQDQANLQIIIMNKNGQSTQSSSSETPNEHPYFGIREVSLVAYDVIKFQSFFICKIY